MGSLGSFVSMPNGENVLGIAKHLLNMDGFGTCQMLCGKILPPVADNAALFLFLALSPPLSLLPSNLHPLAHPMNPSINVGPMCAILGFEAFDVIPVLPTPFPPSTVRGRAVAAAVPSAVAPLSRRI